MMFMVEIKTGGFMYWEIVGFLKKKNESINVLVTGSSCEDAIQNFKKNFSTYEIKAIQCTKFTGVIV